MGHIGVLYTGGTIGSVGTPLGPLSEADFSKAFENIMMPVIRSGYPDCTVAFIPFGAALDSTNLQPGDWCKMANDIIDVYSSYDAFIVLHGTDTMAWTASALSFLMTGLDRKGQPCAVLNKPLIVTGSQMPLFHENAGSQSFGLLYNTDAFQNVCGAVATAYTGISEVAVYFDNSLLKGNRTVKTNASEFHAFSTPNFSNLGEYGIELTLNNAFLSPPPVTSEVSLANADALASLKKQLNYITDHINDSTVITFLSFPAYFDEAISVIGNMLSSSIDQGIAGLILESYGEGNFPSGNPTKPPDGKIYQVLQAAHNQHGVVLMDCTQVLQGIVKSNAYASGSWLAEVGAIGAYDMTPIAALTKLIYLTVLKGYGTNNWSQSTIERLMVTNLCGEIMNVNVLDSRLNPCLEPGESISALDGSATFLNDPALGPVLKDSAGTVLWPALARPKAGDVPGRLVMQADGNLVFYNNSNSPVYASDTAQSAPATSKLVLEGAAEGGPRLYVYYYARNRITKTIYPS